MNGSEYIPDKSIKKIVGGILLFWQGYPAGHITGCGYSAADFALDI